ncbi:uncharacterized protein CMU_037370 [Cryptosporidium muris RN66]|uniref:Uncharacterized protein n=1 Tax=Cryptosporidium muris (strain RN66) TaxID=441375 RepID=B6AH72_CRYMR|nr:uncharacterized protein CMU_037370 [Cryptosporidium muris RN66]EEA07563.1 hypothetical protein CMU_037370 [Cryptosporidium muris RN66]|eukprot:XP_002141912.1 hypothetical protein [Cryptosporidium muris RN66]
MQEVCENSSIWEIIHGILVLWTPYSWLGIIYNNIHYCFLLILFIFGCITLIFDSYTIEYKSADEAQTKSNEFKSNIILESIKDEPFNETTTRINPQFFLNELTIKLSNSVNFDDIRVFIISQLINFFPDYPCKISSQFLDIIYKKIFTLRSTTLKVNDIELLGQSMICQLGIGRNTIKWCYENISRSYSFSLSNNMKKFLDEEIIRIQRVINRERLELIDAIKQNILVSVWRLLFALETIVSIAG